MKGSITVEAAYIFPFCFLIIGIVCYLGIFLYDQSVLKITAYECILQSVNEDEMEGDAEQKVENKARELVKHRILAVRDLKVTVKVTVSKISVSYQGVQSFTNIPVKATVVYEKTFPERILRMLRGKTGETNERNVEKGIESNLSDPEQ